MRSVLIDNATLTGVHRLLGDAPTRSLDSRDGDIICLENLLTSILLYDVVLTTDDYKPKLRQIRHERFPFIQFIPEDRPILDRARTVAQEGSRRIRPEIRAGSFTNPDFAEFLRLLNLNLICNWEITSSVFYLNVRLLGGDDSNEFDKYSPLMQTIFGELDSVDRSDSNEVQPIKLYDRFGKEIDSSYKIEEKSGDSETGGITGGLAAFIAALGWSANRTLFYDHCAQEMRADLLLHPARQAFHLNFQRVDGHLAPNDVASLQRAMSDKTKSAIDHIRTASARNGHAFELPLFVAYYASKCSNPSEMIEACVNDKGLDDATKARERLGELDELSRIESISNYSKQATSVLADLEKSLRVLRRDFGVRTAQGEQTTTTVQLASSASVGFGIPAMPVNAAAEIWEKVSQSRSGASVLYKSIARDLTTVARIGGLYEVVTATVDHNRKLPVFSLKEEDPNYVGSSSWWKKPM